MIILRIILIPFSLIYSAAVYFRNKLYDLGIFRSYSVSKPVVSIGNITTGGTGKTPFVIFLSEYFLSKGKTVGIISRGYKRETNEMITVYDGISINRNIEQTGDELVQIAENLTDRFSGRFFIAAGNDRVSTAEFLINKFNPDVILLDDSFQHRRIKRDLDIVLINSHNYSNERFLNSFTLPSGILREGYSNLSRGDIIVQNNKNEDMPELSALKDLEKDVLSMRYKSEYFMDYKNSILNTDNCNAVVFSGIAADESFIEMIKAGGVTIKEIIKFPDHYNYSQKDIDLLINKYSEDLVYITTEKDFVKIKQYPGFITKYPVYFLKMKIEIDKGSTALSAKLDELIK